MQYNAGDGKELTIEKVSKNYRMLAYANDAWKADEDVVLAAVRGCGWALEYVDKKLRNNRDFIIKAVQLRGEALRYANLFHGDKDVVLKAVQQDGHSIAYATDLLKADRDVVLAAVRQNSYVLERVNARFRVDRDFMLAAVERNRETPYSNTSVVLKFADEALKSDKDFMLAAVQKHGNALKYAHSVLKANKEVVLAAVRNHGMALEFADATLRGDRDVFAEAIKKNFLAFVYALPSDQQTLLTALGLDSRVFGYLQYKLRMDKNFIIKAVKAKPVVLLYVDSKLTKDVVAQILPEALVEELLTKPTCVEITSCNIVDRLKIFVRICANLDKILIAEPDANELWHFLINFLNKDEVSDFYNYNNFKVFRQRSKMQGCFRLISKSKLPKLEKIAQERIGSFLVQ